MSEKLSRLAYNFQQKIKIAGRKNTSRKKFQAELDKLREKHRKTQTDWRLRKKESDKILAEMEGLRQEMLADQTRIVELSKMIQVMDLTGADAAVCYDNGDVGYVIDKEESHVEFDDRNEMILTPMNKWRRTRKQKDDSSSAEIENSDILDQDIDSSLLNDEGNIEDQEIENEDQDPLDDEKLLQFLENF